MGSLPSSVPAAGDRQALPYRADIDGLRAVAVISVVAFHAGISGIPGGFTGVDVFFVISGYLIGAQVFRQSAAGSFRYLPFYARRLRRIIPALIALLLSMFFIGWFMLTPDEMRELGKETVAAVIGASNFLFFLGGDYFAPAADLNPLLHTWSLGVEEQFYILLPVLALLLTRVLKVPAFQSLLAFTALTFVASIALTYANPQAAFYLLPTRFWELSLGALLAISTIESSPKLSGRRSHALAFGGAALIIAGFVLYRPELAFPGSFVLLPTLGAVLVIAARSSWLNQSVLANPVAVFIGKVSYSWYLWHWPLFYLARVLGIEDHLHPAVLIIFSLALGIFSWRVIEQPFRKRRGSDGPLVARYVAAIVSVAVLGAVVYQQDGFAERLPAAAQAAAEDARRTQDDPCLLRRGDNETEPSGCPFSSTVGSALAVVGDSHGASISPGFARAAARGELEFRQFTKSLCTGQWGQANLVDGLPDFPVECLNYQDRVFELIADDPRIEVVVLASRWSLEQQLVTSGASPVADLRTGLNRTLERLGTLNRKVILVQDAPSFHFDPYATVIGDSLPAREFVRNAFDLVDTGGVAAFPEVEQDSSRQILKEVAADHPGVELFDPWAQLCDSQGCRYRDGDDLYYFDNQHLTAVGAALAIGDGPAL